MITLDHFRTCFSLWVKVVKVGLYGFRPSILAQLHRSFLDLRGQAVSHVLWSCSLDLKAFSLCLEQRLDAQRISEPAGLAVARADWRLDQFHLRICCESWPARMLPVSISFLYRLSAYLAIFRNRFLANAVLCGSDIFERQRNSRRTASLYAASSEGKTGNCLASSSLPPF